MNRNEIQKISRKAAAIALIIFFLIVVCLSFLIEKAFTITGNNLYSICIGLVFYYTIVYIKTIYDLMVMK